MESFYCNIINLRSFEGIARNALVVTISTGSCIDSEGLSASDGLHGYIDGASGCRAGNSVVVRAIGDGQTSNGVGDISISGAVRDGKLADGKRISERCCFGEIALGCHIAIERSEVELASE